MDLDFKSIFIAESPPGCDCRCDNSVHQSTKKAASEKRPFAVQRIKFPLELNETQAAVLLMAMGQEADAEEPNEPIIFSKLDVRASQKSAGLLVLG
jgi:hypothetical protein